MKEKQIGWNEIKRLTSYLPEDANTGERRFCYANGITERPKCPECGKPLKYAYQKYHDFCSVKCSRNSVATQQKYKEACLEKYGVENPSQAQSIKQKKIDTCLEHFGVESPLQSPRVREQIINSNLEKYGVENVSQREDVKQKKIQTSLERFGVENPYQSEELKAKIRKTCIERYGVENPNQSECVKAKSRKTSLEKYGVEHPQQNAEWHENNQRYRTKTTIISGHEIRYQGYELAGWNTLLAEGLSVDQIVYKKGEMPEFRFRYDNKNRRYYPDFYIPSKNLIIEIKSTWTMKKYYELNLAKQQCVIDAGYNFQFWICSETKVLTII